MKTLGESTTTTLTPKRKVIEFKVQTPIGAPETEARIVATAEEAEVNAADQRVKRIRTLDLETTGAALIAADHVDATRFAALYTEISEILHRAFDAQE